MSELKKCPFCGGEAIVGANEYYDGANTFYIYCASCGVRQTTTKIRTDEAVTAWNNRAQPENEPPCYLPEQNNPYPLCVGRGMAVCAHCCMWADYEPEESDYKIKAAESAQEEKEKLLERLKELEVKENE